MFSAAQISEIREIARLEALRAAVFSCASESLDENVSAMLVTVRLSGDTLAATVDYIDASGSVLAGFTL